MDFLNARETWRESLNKNIKNGFVFFFFLHNLIAFPTRRAGAEELRTCSEEDEATGGRQ